MKCFYNLYKIKILLSKHTGKRHLGSPRRRSKDNITMDLEEIGINFGELG
jgi:hypothetical protein